MLEHNVQGTAVPGRGGEAGTEFELSSAQQLGSVCRDRRGLVMELGVRIRLLRRERGLTLRALAEKAGVNHTYLSKIENSKPGFEPGAETIRSLASALGADALELLELAGKTPPELQHIASSASGRRFYQCSKAITAPEDWDALSEVLERKLQDHVAKGR
jgi:transcriptional regulator with XRE-family HTH domain